MSKRKAFTLVEALVVIAIIGLMVTVAMPAFNRFFQMYKFRTAMNQVVTDIRAARQAAITNGRPVKITLIDLADYPTIRGMTGGYAIYMLNVPTIASGATLANWEEIAPARLPCGGIAEKPRFLPEPIQIPLADANLLNLETDDGDGTVDLVFLGNGSVYEGAYALGGFLEFKNLDDTSVPGDLSPGFIMTTVKGTAVDRYAIYLSLFGKVSVHSYRATS